MLSCTASENLPRAVRGGASVSALTAAKLGATQRMRFVCSPSVGTFFFFWYALKAGFGSAAGALASPDGDSAATGSEESPSGVPGGSDAGELNWPGVGAWDQTRAGKIPNTSGPSKTTMPAFLILSTNLSATNRPG